MARLFLNPLVRLRRIPYRCGYGVHSPYAFDFITGVIYEGGIYYAYKELDALLPSLVQVFGLRERKIMRLLFRVANFSHPRHALVVNASAVPYAYMKAAVPSASWTDKLTGKADFIYLDKACDDVFGCVAEDTILFLDHLREHKEWWERLKQNPLTAITFDLYDVGIALFDRTLNRKDYIVSF